MNRERAEDLILDKLYGEITPADEKDLTTFLRDNPDMAGELSSMKSALEEYRRLPVPTPPQLNIQTTLAKSKDNNRTPEQESETTPDVLIADLSRPKTGLLNPAIGIAAALILVAGLAIYENFNPAAVIRESSKKMKTMPSESASEMNNKVAIDRGIPTFDDDSISAKKGISPAKRLGSAPAGQAGGFNRKSAELSSTHTLGEKQFKEVKSNICPRQSKAETEAGVITKGGISKNDTPTIGKSDKSYAPNAGPSKLPPLPKAQRNATELTAQRRERGTLAKSESIQIKTDAPSVIMDNLQVAQKENLTENDICNDREHPEKYGKTSEISLSNKKKRRDIYSPNSQIQSDAKQDDRKASDNAPLTLTRQKSLAQEELKMDNPVDTQSKTATESAHIGELKKKNNPLMKARKLIAENKFDNALAELNSLLDNNQLQTTDKKQAMNLKIACLLNLKRFNEAETIRKNLELMERQTK